MSKGGKQQSTGVQTVQQEPAAFIKPYLTEAATASQDLYQNFRPEYFSGSTFVPYSPETETALQAQTMRAMSGNPAVQAAQGEALKTIQGGYLSGSPALQQELQKIQGNINSQFAQGGGYRSSANQEVLAREMSNAALRNYDTERGRQQQAIFASPALAGQDYADIAALRDVGAQREDLFGRQLQDQMGRFDFSQLQDPQALDDYIRRVTQLGGGYSTQTQTGTAPTVGRSVGQGLMSGAKAGIGLGTSLGSAALGPWALGGAVLGAVLG